jgi:hypothetical protein
MCKIQIEHLKWDGGVFFYAGGELCSTVKEYLWEKLM